MIASFMKRNAGTRWGIKNPFEERQLWEKFSNCCEPMMGKQKTQQFYESLQNMEKEKSIRSILLATVGYRDTGEN